MYILDILLVLEIMFGGLIQIIFEAIFLSLQILIKTWDCRD